MLLYRGTTHAEADSIRRDGLPPGAFVTTDLADAEEFAARRVIFDAVNGWTALIVTVEADPDELIRDPNSQPRFAEEAGRPWFILRRRRPAIALRRIPIRWEMGGSATPTAVTPSPQVGGPVFPKWAGFA
jgi:hypothetical protein